MNHSDALNLFGITGKIPTLEEVKSIYRQLMKKWHPDKYQTEDEIAIATKKAQEINQAICLLEEWIDSLPKHGFGSATTDEFKAWTEKSSGKPRYTYNERTFTPGFPDDTAFEFFVKSSHIVSAGYNRNTKKMYIKFDDNSVYEYLNVDPELFEQFMQASSHGKFAHRNIYPNRKYRRCIEPNKPYRPDMLYSRMSGRYNSDPSFRIGG